MIMLSTSLPARTTTTPALWPQPRPQSPFPQFLWKYPWGFCAIKNLPVEGFRKERPAPAKTNRRQHIP